MRIARPPLSAPITSPLWKALREHEGADSGDDHPEQDSRTRSEEQPTRAILCAACRHEITDPEARIEMAGRHQHTCVNPAGFVYRIGCFRAARGCATTGGLSADYSWFNGYVWQVACCAACSIHLGWAFEPERAAEEHARFWGLIVDRLEEAEERPA